MHAKQQRPLILIVSAGGDDHAVLVDMALNRLGCKTVLYSQSSLINKGDVCIRLDAPNAVIELADSGDVPIDHVVSFWNRRSPQELTYPPQLHTADKGQIFASCHGAMDGIRSAVEHRFCVNPDRGATMANNKVRQLLTAKAAGARVPKTLISNNYGQVKAFTSSMARSCVKPFEFYAWETASGVVKSTTSLIRDLSQLTPDNVQIAPMIYQEYIEKAFDVRIVTFGGYTVATRISPGPGVDVVDWRHNLRYLRHLSPIAVPGHVEQQIRKIMGALGIRFGAFDYVVSRQGEWVFLEVNQAGQFLWQEEWSESTYILEPFARYLKDGSDDFSWDPRNPSMELSLPSLLQQMQSDGGYAEFLTERTSCSANSGHIGNEQEDVRRPR